LSILKWIFGFLLKLILGILLLWLSAALGYVLFDALKAIPWMQKEAVVFTACFILYFLMHILLYKPILSHVLAHELTHALAATLMGGKVSSIEASEKGGTTMVNKSHIFISLAPYIFPFYTAIAVAFYAIAAHQHQVYVIVVIGFTYAFHIALTVYSLSHHQPDLQEGGVVFSLIVILAGNLVVLTLLICLLWPQTLTVPQAVSATGAWGQTIAQALWGFAKPYFSHLEAHPQ
jgi:hypothetical protein